ncbi:MAG: hypothetical protein JW818_01985 [Pirellulales bacterium]|nr:hypothetical protein [Pirellulales bacterium]
MNSFHVWIRPLGSRCRVRVDGLQNAQWLLGQLGQLFVFKTAEPVNEESDSLCCSFLVQYDPQTSHRGLEKTLAGIPEVILMTDPA